MEQANVLGVLEPGKPQVVPVNIAFLQGIPPQGNWEMEIVVLVREQA